MNKYLRQLQKDNIINNELFCRIRSTCSYGQPKTHKHDYLLRPIISSKGSYIYELSKYLANLLKNNRLTEPNLFINDSFDFVRRIKNINVIKITLYVASM